MPDHPNPIKPGEMGTAYEIGRCFGGGNEVQIWVRWDSGRSLNLCWPVDQFEVVESSGPVRFRVLYETGNGGGVECGIVAGEESLRDVWAKRCPERKILGVIADAVAARGASVVQR